MHWIIIIAVIIALYLMFIAMLFYVSFFIFPVACVALIGVVLYNYLATMWREMVVGTGWADSPDGPEPAFRQYYFRKAYRDYRLVVEESGKLNIAIGHKLAEWGKKFFVNEFALFTWPLGVTYYAVMLAGALAGLLGYALFGLVHLALVLTCAATAVVLSLLMRAFEYVSMAWRRIFLVCPHANCYRPITLPIYICPNCGEEHHRLIPGTYGIFRRTCQCTARLPTLFLFGRHHLPSICPHEECRRPLPGGVFGVTRNIHLPIVGGPATGKTSFLMASMCELSERAAAGELGLEFPEKKHEALFQKSSLDFKTGAIVRKTAEESPDAFLVKLRDGGGGEGLLYVYDAAGELYQQTDVLQRHEYYSYTHGILFLLDPFSLPQVQVDFGPSLAAAAAQVKPCEERAQDVYDRMVGTLRQFSKMGRRFGSIPFAVVVTKSDAFGLASQIEAAASRGAAHDQSKDADPESRAVRQWLVECGESNLVLSIENDFKNVRFFHCSALGRLPDASSSPFDPQGVLDPLGWALKSYGVDLDHRGPLAAPSAGAAPKIAVGVRSYQGAVVAASWLLATIGLFVLAGGVAIKYPEWSRSTYASESSNYNASYTPTPRPLVGRRGTTTTDVNLRSSASPNSGKVGLAERGSHVRVLSASGDWYEVEVTQHGRRKQDPRSSDRGWLNSRYLTLE